MTAFRLLIVAALIVAAAGWYVFYPRPPAPTGPHPVGFLDMPLQVSPGTTLPVAIWYPRDLAKPAPVILFSPGWGSRRTQNRLQTENLASHGFVVVACDDIASDPATDPNHGVFLDLLSDAGTKASIERAGRNAVAQGARLIAVLDALTAAGGKLTGLPVTLELGRVGALGYSMGGTSTLAAAAKDPRIAGVFNLDGGLFGPAADDIVVPAYFLLSSLEAFPSQAELSSPDAYTRNYALISALDIPRNRRRMERPMSYWAQLPHAGHGDLGDGLFVCSSGEWQRTNFERRAMYSAIAELEVAFFRSVLLGEPAPLHGLLGHSDQTLRWISPTSPPAGTAKARQ